uniref:Uncharacterized protein n=1 Tax=Leptospirillum ferrodiazotrophum TaxID=412449 RepID=C6HVJ4_9BACT|nr:MAG: hypothetical protein UBAL3_79320002 [Leptospirillum ferrodiazotrophum]
MSGVLIQLSCFCPGSGSRESLVGQGPGEGRMSLQTLLRRVSEFRADVGARFREADGGSGEGNGMVLTMDPLPPILGRHRRSHHKLFSLN